MTTGFPKRFRPSHMGRGAGGRMAAFFARTLRSVEYRLRGVSKPARKSMDAVVADEP